MTTTLSLRGVRRLLVAGVLLAVAGCSNFFDVQNENAPTQDDLVINPTRLKLTDAATGVFASARGGIQSLIWRLGSMGREGINLSGNNQPDYQEPYFGPLQGSGFGAAIWGDRYSAIRSINIYLDALGSPKNPLSAGETAASRGMANTFKALAFMYIIETRASLGAPVDVDRPVDAPPAPFLSEDSVYGYILGLLDNAETDLTAAGSTDFPFPVPPGLAAFNTPATFIPFNRALHAKAEVLRATAGCRGSASTCWNAALTDLGSSFLVADSTQFQVGAYFDFSSAPGDVTNDLSEPLSGVTFYALPDFYADAQTQPGGHMDRRVDTLDVFSKIVPAQDTQILGGIAIHGTTKFRVFFTNGSVDPNHGIAIIRNEELILLRAEANIGLNTAGSLAAAIADLNLVREGSGGLAPTTLTVASPQAQFIDELLYERRYSLMWEQGTRWIDARRYNLLNTIPADVTNGSVPDKMPIPNTECSARGLAANCTPPTIP